MEENRWLQTVWNSVEPVSATINTNNKSELIQLTILL